MPVGFTGVNTVTEYDPRNRPSKLSLNEYTKATNPNGSPLTRHSYFSPENLNTLWGPKSNGREPTTRELLEREEFDRAFHIYYDIYRNRGYSSTEAKDAAADMASKHIRKHAARLAHKGAIYNRGYLQQENPDLLEGNIITGEDPTRQEREQLALNLAKIRNNEKAYRNAYLRKTRTRKSRKSRKTRSKA
jgi:hypothetical protein